MNDNNKNEGEILDLKQLGKYIFQKICTDTLQGIRKHYRKGIYLAGLLTISSTYNSIDNSKYLEKIQALPCIEQQISNIADRNNNGLVSKVEEEVFIQDVCRNLGFSPDERGNYSAEQKLKIVLYDRNK